MINRNYIKKLDENGQPIVENGDYVMELVSSEEVPDEVLPPNWYGLEQGLYKSSLFSKYILDYNTKGLLLTTVLQNGKKGEDVNQDTLLTGFAVMGIAFTDAEKAVISSLLTDNHFTVQLQ